MFLKDRFTDGFHSDQRVTRAFSALQIPMRLPGSEISAGDRVFRMSPMLNPKTNQPDPEKARPDLLGVKMAMWVSWNRNHKPRQEHMSRSYKCYRSTMTPMKSRSRWLDMLCIVSKVGCVFLRAPPCFCWFYPETNNHHFEGSVVHELVI